MASFLSSICELPDMDQKLKTYTSEITATILTKKILLIWGAIYGKGFSRGTQVKKY